jgi:hypothetical protein
MDWSDPERAAQLIDSAQNVAMKRSPELQMMEVRGMVFADVRRDADFDATTAKLHSIAQEGDEAAVLAEHYVRAYSFYQHDQYAAASRELSHIEIDAIASDTERYRVAILRGNTFRMLGQAESALPFLEEGLDIAREMHDDTRTLHAMLWLARIYVNTGNFDRASGQLAAARTLAMTLGDERRWSKWKGVSRMWRTGAAIMPRSDERASPHSSMRSGRAATSGWRMRWSISAIHISRRMTSPNR